MVLILLSLVILYILYKLVKAYVMVQSLFEENYYGYIWDEPQYLKRIFVFTLCKSFGYDPLKKTPIYSKDMKDLLLNGEVEDKFLFLIKDFNKGYEDSPSEFLGFGVIYRITETGVYFFCSRCWDSPTASLNYYAAAPKDRPAIKKKCIEIACEAYPEKINFVPNQYILCNTGALERKLEAGRKEVGDSILRDIERNRIEL